MRRRRAVAVLLVLGLLVLLTVVLTGRDDAPNRAQSQAPVGSASATPGRAGVAAPVTTPRVAVPASAAAATIGAAAGLGPRRTATVPAATTQVLVVRGDARASASATVDLYQRSAGGWVRTATWRGHNGAKGWTDDHREGDLRTPTGTYSLTDAGGRQPDPGTALPYHRSPSFVPRGDSVFGDSLEGSFDYVVAIDYNRRKGRSPLDTTRPLGQEKGGGIWLHVDHGGPTHGCVSLPEAGMRQLLAALRPEARPLVVMGDPNFLRT